MRAAVIAALGLGALLAACDDDAGERTARGGQGGDSGLPPPQTSNRNIETPYCELAGEPEVGATEIARSSLSDRTLDISLESLALQEVQHIVVTLPRGYDPAGRTRYPVLYLLHGALDDYLSYYDNGIEALVGDLPLIVVSPNSGQGNGYADWYGALAATGQRPRYWETHHLREVIPFVEANFPVRTDRAGRAVAGISMGGHGTMTYAAAHPELFRAAGSFSGAVNLVRDYPWYPVLQTGTTALTLLFGPAGYCTYGDFVLQRGVWQDHDPVYLAGNLRGVALWMSCGGGEPDAIPYLNSALDPVELEVCEMTENFIEALDRQDIAHTTSLYDNGTHEWRYWTREIASFLPWLMREFAQPAPAPETFSFRSLKPRFSAWGWDFRAYRDAREFIYLDEVGAAGFTVTGSGILDVVTPPLYQPRAPHRVTVNGELRSLRSDGDGRLTFRLDLGPSHVPQQMEFEEQARAGWTKLIVEISPAH